MAIIDLEGDLKELKVKSLVAQGSEDLDSTIMYRIDKCKSFVFLDSIEITFLEG